MHQEVQGDNPVKFIRLNTGEDLISEMVVIENSECMTFINPLKIIYSVSPNKGSLLVTLVQWVFSNICENQEFIINPDDIITVQEPTAEIVDYYFEAIRNRDATKEKSANNIRDTIEKLDNKNVYPPSDDVLGMTEVEMEMLNKIMDEVNNTKRKLH
jgi:hypothetical protein